MMVHNVFSNQFGIVDASRDFDYAGWAEWSCFLFFFQFFFFSHFKTPPTSVVSENAAPLFYCDAPETFHQPEGEQIVTERSFFDERIL